MWVWERIELRGGRGDAAAQRLDHYRRLRFDNGVWGHRRRSRFWLSVPPGGRRILRPVLRARFIESGNEVVVRGRIRPVAWTGWFAAVGPVVLVLAALPGTAHADLALVGASFLMLTGLAWLERSDYQREARFLRATAAAIVGSSYPQARRRSRRP